MDSPKFITEQQVTTKITEFGQPTRRGKNPDFASFAEPTFTSDHKELLNTPETKVSNTTRKGLVDFSGFSGDFQSDKQDLKAEWDQLWKRYPFIPLTQQELKNKVEQNIKIKCDSNPKKIRITRHSEPRRRETEQQRADIDLFIRRIYASDLKF